MFGHIGQKELDDLLRKFYTLGYKAGQIEERSQQWTSQSDGLSLVEKQILIILQKEGLDGNDR